MAVRTRDLQVGHGKTGEASLWLGAATGCTFVANLTAATGGRARERGNRGRVVVSFDFHQDVHRFLHRAVLAGFRVRKKRPATEPTITEALSL